MKKLLTTTILVSMMATGANAGSNHHNNYDNSVTDNSTTNNPHASAYGGDGGNAKSNSKANSNATGLGLGIAGVNKSGNSKNTNTLKNNQKLLNTIKSSNTQKQGQAQGLINSNKAVNGGNKSRNDNINGALNEGNNSDLKSDVNTDVNIVNKQSKIPVNPAYAPSLTATSVCLGSISVGVQGASFGVSAGKTTLDEGCDLQRLVKLSTEQYGIEVGNTILCQNDDRVRKALITATGYDCKPEIKQEVTYNSRNTCEYPTSTGCGRRR